MRQFCVILQMVLVWGSGHIHTRPYTSSTIGIEVVCSERKKRETVSFSSVYSFFFYPLRSTRFVPQFNPYVTFCSNFFENLCHSRTSERFNFLRSACRSQSFTFRRLSRNPAFCLNNWSGGDALAATAVAQCSPGTAGVRLLVPRRQ